MNKKTFEDKLSGYIQYFEDCSLDDTKENISYLKKYAQTVFSTLKRAYLKEHESLYVFERNILVMKQDISDTKYRNIQDLICEILEDLDFLRRRYVVKYDRL